MGAATSRSDYTEFHCRADRAAARLVLNYHLAPEDRHDLCQDLLVDLLSRLKGFDPCLGTLGAFSAVVIRHGMARIAVRLRHARSRHAPMSLDDPISEGDPTTFGDTFSEEDGYLAWVGSQINPIAAMESRLSFDRAFATLSAEQVKLCRDLLAGSPWKGAAGPSRATVYRHIHEVGLCLLAAGIGLKP
jgi:DNA-directed RNA polymerase specialized sigma24 family protein